MNGGPPHDKITHCCDLISKWLCANPLSVCTSNVSKVRVKRYCPSSPCPPEPAHTLFPNVLWIWGIPKSASRWLELTAGFSTCIATWGWQDKKGQGGNEQLTKVVHLLNLVPALPNEAAGNRLHSLHGLLFYPRGWFVRAGHHGVSKHLECNLIDESKPNPHHQVEDRKTLVECPRQTNWGLLTVQVLPISSWNAWMSPSRQHTRLQIRLPNHFRPLISKPVHQNSTVWVDMFSPATQLWACCTNHPCGAPMP